MGAYHLEDRKGAQVLLIKLLLGAQGFNILGIKVNRLTNLVLVGRLVFPIGKLLIAGLGRGHLGMGIVNDFFYLFDKCLSIPGS
jgi:hypothetical protein